MTTAEIQAQISSTAISQGVDPALALAVANQESGFNPLAVSPKGAAGVFQLMPATAASLGVSDSFDVTQNINGGVSLLAQLNQQFAGNVPLVLAAYNAGPGAVNQAGGIPPYPETQNYVASILAALGIGGDSTAAGDPSGVAGDGGGVPAPVVAGFPLGFALTVGAFVLWALARK